MLYLLLCLCWIRLVVCLICCTCWFRVLVWFFIVGRNMVAGRVVWCVITLLRVAFGALCDCFGVGLCLSLLIADLFCGLDWRALDVTCFMWVETVSDVCLFELDLGHLFWFLDFFRIVGLGLVMGYLFVLLISFTCYLLFSFVAWFVVWVLWFSCGWFKAVSFTDFWFYLGFWG